MTRILLEPSEVKSLIKYDPNSGLLWHKKRPRSLFPCNRSFSVWNSKFAGKPAFSTVDRDGYLHGKMFNRNYFAHRVAWCVSHGYWPKNEIDHINGDVSDNRIANLRDVDSATQKKNSRLRSDNKSGVPGVSWNADSGRWYVKISKQHLGCFKRLDDAKAARLAAEKSLGYHTNHGRA